MILTVRWTRPLKLTSGTANYPSYEPPLSNLPDQSGVYVFGRQYGKVFEALYVGKANNIRRRVKGQCNNLRLMRHLENARNGKRVVLAGVFLPKPGQQLQKCLTLVERALIRHFLSDGHDLVNKMGVRLRQHEILSEGNHPKKSFPQQIFLQK